MHRFTSFIGLLLGMLLEVSWGQSVCGNSDPHSLTNSGAYRRCSAEFRGVNMAGTTLEDNWEGAKSCNGCKEACWKQSDGGKGCNVWVFCDNPNGCDNGYGEVFPAYTCTLKHQDDEHSLIVNPTGHPAAYEKPPNAAASYNDWVSGTCEICPCCGWCDDANSCQRECYYCGSMRKCASGYLSAALHYCQSENCKDMNKDVSRTDCVRSEACGQKGGLCPDTMYIGVGKAVKLIPFMGPAKKCG